MFAWFALTCENATKSVLVPEWSWRRACTAGHVRSAASSSSWLRAAGSRQPSAAPAYAHSTRTAPIRRLPLPCLDKQHNMLTYAEVYMRLEILKINISRIFLHFLQKNLIKFSLSFVKTLYLQVKHGVSNKIRPYRVGNYLSIFCMTRRNEHLAK